MPRITQWTSAELLAYWQPPQPELDLTAKAFEDRVYPNLPETVRAALRQSRSLVRSLMSEVRR